MGVVLESEAFKMNFLKSICIHLWKMAWVSTHARHCSNTLNMGPYQQHCEKSRIVTPIFKWGTATLGKCFKSSEIMSLVNERAGMSIPPAQFQSWASCLWATLPPGKDSLCPYGVDSLWPGMRFDVWYEAWWKSSWAHRLGRKGPEVENWKVMGRKLLRTHIEGWHWCDGTKTVTVGHSQAIFFN